MVEGAPPSFEARCRSHLRVTVLSLPLPPSFVSVAQADRAGAVAGRDGGRFVGKEHAAPLIGVAARKRAQRARTIEPAIDLRAPVAAQGALGGAVVGPAIRADQAVGFCWHVTSVKSDEATDTRFPIKRLTSPRTRGGGV